jgi:hypothetical protein
MNLDRVFLSVDGTQMQRPAVLEEMHKKLDMFFFSDYGL